MAPADINYTDVIMHLAERLDSACMWFGSVARARTNPRRLYELDAQVYMALLFRQCEALTTQLRNDAASAAGAHIISRPMFESGVNIHWLLQGGKDEDSPSDGEGAMARHIGLLRRDVLWAERMCSRLQTMGFDEKHWLDIREERTGRLESAFSFYYDRQLPVNFKYEMPPNIQQALKSFALERLYWGYMVSSQWIHGTAFGAFEFDEH